MAHGVYIRMLMAILFAHSSVEMAHSVLQHL